MKPTLIALAAASFAVPALAQETRELDAHVHGVSTAEIAIEHGKIEIKLLSPGMDIVGFEYGASSAKDKDAVEAAIRQFLAPDEIVTLPEAASCRLTEVLAHLHSGEHDHHYEEHDDEHEEHDDDHAHDEGHDDDGHDHEEHAEDEHEEGAEHSEFHVRYIFACEDEDALTSVSFPFFERFENAQEIEVKFVTETGAGTAELTRDASVLTFE